MLHGRTMVDCNFTMRSLKLALLTYELWWWWRDEEVEVDKMNTGEKKQSV